MRFAAQRPGNLSQQLVAAAALLAGSVLLYSLLGERDKGAIESATPGEDRGYYLTDATLTEMGQDGKPRVKLHAASIEQQVADQSVRMSDVQLDYSAQQTGQWKVTADRGRMPPAHDSVMLSGDVRVTGTEARGSAVITTDELEYDTKTNFVQTADPVTLRFGTRELNGRGMRVDLNTGTLKLESNVNGRFTP